MTGADPDPDRQRANGRGGNVMHYCTACDWDTASDGEHVEGDPNERAIRHYLETAHSVVQRSFDGQADRSRSMRIGSRL